MLRFPLAALAALVALAGCAVPSTAERDLALAQHADSTGHPWTAYRLYRSAARGGSLWAQVRLAEPYVRIPGSSGGRSVSEHDAWFSPAPGPAERTVWERVARSNAERLAAADDPFAHEVLAMMALGDGGFVTVDGEPQPFDYTEARRHYERAIALGSTRAVQGLALIVWQTDGLLAAEPYFRKSYAAGNRESVQMLAWIALSRPALERGVRSQNHTGDLSLLDVVDYVRVLRTAGDAESVQYAEQKIGEIRGQAQAGNAQSDSLLRAIDAAGLLGPRG